MKISMITAMTRDRVIGQGNKQLPWKIRGELAYFKQITLHKVVIMGGNTFASIKHKPLINRFNIVLTSHPEKFAHSQKLNKFNTILPSTLLPQCSAPLVTNSSGSRKDDNNLLDNHITTANLVFARNVAHSLRLASNFYQLLSSAANHERVAGWGGSTRDNNFTAATSCLYPPKVEATTTTVDDPAVHAVYPEIMVIGGREVYQQFLPLATKLYISMIKHDYRGDVFFPSYDKSLWCKTFSKEYPEFVAEIWELI